MKYIVILALVIIVMRVEFILGLIDKAADKVASAPVDVASEDVGSDREVIPLSKDPNFKQTPRKIFMALLEDFHANPIKPYREKALSILKENPQMFNQKLDAELESQIFRWRDLLINNDQEAINFLHELMNTLQGENQLMIKRFFSLLMGINMENFISAYSRSKDINCTIATLMGDQIPEEEARYEIYERESELKAYVAKDNIPPHLKSFASNCLLVLGVEISKFPPPPATENGPAPEAVPSQEPSGENQ